MIDLIERYDVCDKTVMEMGCGNGEFLRALCALGHNRGVGFDPSQRREADDNADAGRIEFIQGFYSDRYADYTADLICCRHMLVQLPALRGLMGLVQRALGDRADAVV